MKLIVCLDSRNGWLFNNRRQSRDQYLNRRITELCKNSTLCVGQLTSYMLLNDVKDEIISNNVNLVCVYSKPNKAVFGDENVFCFAEAVSMIDPYYDYSEVIIFTWDRVYPYDKKFPLDFLKTNAWKITEFTELTGSSHFKITEEHYVRMTPKAGDI